MSRPRSLLTRGPFVSGACMRSGSFSSESSSHTIRKPEDQTAENGTHKRQTLQTLSLPFESRQRESHLVTDEEFDEIAKNVFHEEVFDPRQPTKPRRSMSTNRNSWFSNFAPRTRPASYAAGPSNVEPVYKLRQALENWQKELNAHQGEPGWPSHTSHIIEHEPLSFTALPDPPTKNSLAEYPAEDLSPAVRPLADDTTSIQPRRSISTAPRPEPADVTARPYRVKAKHQRGFSVQAISANVVETFKKRVLNRKPSPLDDGAAECRSNSELGHEIDLQQHVDAAPRTSTDCVQVHQTEAYDEQPINAANSVHQSFTQTKKKTRKLTASSSTTVPSFSSTWATTTAATTPFATVPDPVLGFTPHPTSNAAAYQASHGVFSPSELPAYTKEQLHIIIVQQRAYISNLELQNKCAIEQCSTLQEILSQLGNERNELRDELHQKDIHISKLIVRVSELERGFSKL